MDIVVHKRITPDAIVIEIEFGMDEIKVLPGWCISVMNSIGNFVDRPVKLIEALHAVAQQIYRYKKNLSLLDTPPARVGDLKAENVKEVGSGPDGETVMTVESSPARLSSTAPETHGAPAPEGSEENGGVVQRIEDLECKVDRLEIWVLNLIRSGNRRSP